VPVTRVSCEFGGADGPAATLRDMKGLMVVSSTSFSSLSRFGYATDEVRSLVSLLDLPQPLFFSFFLTLAVSITQTPELMPKTIMLAHQLNAAMAAARRDGSLGWLRPDSKTQVTIEYKKDQETGAMVPLRVDTIVISTQHAEEITTEELRKEIKEKIIKKVISSDLLDERTVYHVGFWTGVVS
jgi:hypothetical protein